MNIEQLFIGIDVSKGYSDFIILKSNQMKIEHGFQLDDNADGHHILKNKLKDLTTKGYSVICGVENTGGYERNWVSCIKTLSKTNSEISVYKLNPKAVKHQIQSLLKRTIDDGVSAEGIASYMINNHQKLKTDWRNSTMQSEQTTELKMLHSMIQGLIKQRTMKKNQLEKVLYQAFPEFLKTLSNSRAKWVHKLLEKYPTASSIKRAKLAGLMSIKGISEQKAKSLKEKAKNSVASTSGPTIGLIIHHHSRDILLLEDEITKLKNVLINMNKNNPEVKRLTSLNGVADWLANAFLIELGDGSRFETTDQLAAFFGINPSFKKSGDGLYRARMSKQGSATMRAVLYQIAHGLYLHNDYFKKIYARYRSKGKGHRSVMGILMHKALRVMWGMLKSKTEFNSKTDAENQQKNIQNDEIKPISKKSRRLQALTLNAPISKSNNKKRKAMLKPQSSTKDEHPRSFEHSPIQT